MTIIDNRITHIWQALTSTIKYWQCINLLTIPVKYWQYLWEHQALRRVQCTNLTFFFQSSLGNSQIKNKKQFKERWKLIRYTLYIVRTRHASHIYINYLIFHCHVSDPIYAAREWLETDRFPLAGRTRADLRVRCHPAQHISAVIFFLLLIVLMTVKAFLHNNNY